MVHAPSRADPEAARGAQAAWLTRIAAILSVARGGIVVALHGAHPAAARPLVLALLQGHHPQDSDAPVVAVCFSPRELLYVPHGARVVLLGADRDPAWLNLQRPIVHERELAVFLWDTGPEVQVLRRQAPDFLDWVSHRIDVPAFAPTHAVNELRRMTDRFRWVAVQGMAVALADLDGSWNELGSLPPHDRLVALLEAGDVIVHGLERDLDVWRLLLAHAEVRWSHRVLLSAPRIVPPFVPLVSGSSADWEALARRLEAKGVANPRIEAALLDLVSTTAEANERARVNVLGDDPRLRDLLRSAAQGEKDADRAEIALKATLPDVAESWARSAWRRGELAAASVLAQALAARVSTIEPSSMGDAYEEAKNIEQQLPAIADEHIWDVGLPGLYEGLGRLALAAGDVDAARGWYERVGREIVRSGPLLMPEDATSITVTLYENQAEVAYLQGRLSDAWTLLNEARKLYERRLSEHPDDIDERLSLGRCLGELGDVCLWGDMLAEARQYYERSRSIFEHAARSGTDIPSLQHDLITAYRRDAALLARQQRVEEARARMEVVLMSIEALRRTQPASVDLAHDLIFALRQADELALTEGRDEQWKRWFDESERLTKLDIGERHWSSGPWFDLHHRLDRATSREGEPPAR